MKSVGTFTVLPLRSCFTLFFYIGILSDVLIDIYWLHDLLVSYVLGSQSKTFFRDILFHKQTKKVHIVNQVHVKHIYVN